MSAASRWRDRIYESIGLKEWKYDRLNQTDNNDQQSQSRQDATVATTSPSWPRAKILKISAIVLAVFLFLVLVFRPSPSKITNLIIFEEEVRSAYFYLILPASAASTDFCKTIFSAAALDYPTPRILNWDKKFDDPKLPHGGHDIGKVHAIHDLLQELGDHTNDDLMLIADGYETWFQLRPSVVIDRYYAINDRANKRIVKRLGSRAADGSEISQRIIFSAQKKCSSERPDSVECSAIPESDLPSDIYGSQTDKDGGDGTKNRPRYLNAGTVMGHIGDLRKLYAGAIETMKAKNYTSDTEVFAHMFGEQEHGREVSRTQSSSLWQRFKPSILRRTRAGILARPPHPTTRDRLTIREDKDEAKTPPPPRDYGIGLDYRGEISQPADFGQDDFAWLAHNATDKFRRLARRSGLSAEISPEVAYSTPPFWTPDYTGYVKAPDADWSQVPLFTDLWTGVSPAAVRLDRAAGARNSLVERTWDRTWFLPYLRAILVAKARAPRMAHAVVQGAAGPEEWWGPDDGRGGLRIETGSLPGNWKPWHDVCGSQEVAEAVLVDGRGPWHNPGWMLEHDGGVSASQLKEWFAQWWAVEDGTVVWGEKLP